MRQQRTGSTYRNRFSVSDKIPILRLREAASRCYKKHLTVCLKKYFAENLQFNHNILPWEKK